MAAENSRTPYDVIGNPRRETTPVTGYFFFDARSAPPAEAYERKAESYLLSSELVWVSSIIKDNNNNISPIRFYISN